MHASKYLACALALSLAACGKSPVPTDNATESGMPPTTQAAPATDTIPATDPVETAPVVDTAAPLRVGDLDAYARGMHKEIELLKLAGEKATKARASNDLEAQTAALMEATGVEIDKAGAEAAGMALARYGHVKNVVDSALNLVSLHEAMAKQQASTATTPVQFADPYAGLDADVADALKTRQVELNQLRMESVSIRVHMTES